MALKLIQSARLLFVNCTLLSTTELQFVASWTHSAGVKSKRNKSNVAYKSQKMSGMASLSSKIFFTFRSVIIFENVCLFRLSFCMSL